MTRGSILTEAHAIINGERQDQYGDPEDAFQAVAELWNAYMGPVFTPRDVAIMMCLFKIARESHQHKRDNLVDAAGYLGLAGDMNPNGESE